MAVRDLIARRRDEVLRAAARHRARRIRLFGCAARGEERPDSEVDFLVDFEPNATLLDLGALKDEIESLLGRQADVMTPAGISPFLRERILREAAPL